MAYNKIEKIHKTREYRAVISNKLIQEGLLPQLTALEYKVFLYIVSLIKRPRNVTDIQSEEYSFNIGELCNILGLHAVSGKNYSDIRRATKKLRDKSFWLHAGNNNYVTVSILSKVKENRNSGTMRVRFDEDICPFVINVLENTTRITLVYVLRMSSAYSFQLYLICRSYAGVHTLNIDYTQLKEKMGCTSKYSEFFNFKARVLIPALQDINSYSDLSVTYAEHREGNSVTSLTFNIKEKKRLECYAVSVSNTEVLDANMVNKIPETIADRTSPA